MAFNDQHSCQNLRLHRWPRTARAVLCVSLSGLGALIATPTSAAATDIKVGGIAIVAPRYEGSDRYEVRGAPFAYPVFSGGSDGSFTINGADDVRFRVFEHQGVEAGVLGGYAFGRDESDGILLRGLGDVDGGFIAGAFVGYRFGTTLFDVSYHRIVSGDTGGFFRLGVSNKYRATEALTLSSRVGATYADSDYMSDYFAITGAQSAASTAGLAVYDTDAGFKDVHLSFGATYDIDARWSLLGSVGYKRLIGDAEDSPIVESPDQFSATLGVTYKFSID